MRSIEILPVMNGWVVKCGCQALAYSRNDKEQLKIDINHWLDKPDETEQAIMNREDLFKQFIKKDTGERTQCDAPTDQAPAQCVESVARRVESMFNRIR